MSLYMIASLLEHELLISLANQIMHSPHHKAPTDDDLKNAHEFADLALQLALEGCQQSHKVTIIAFYKRKLH